MVSPASLWAQRWAHGRQRWRHAHHRGAFEPDAYTVEALSEQAARAYIVANHYSGSYPAALRRYGPAPSVWSAWPCWACPRRRRPSPTSSRDWSRTARRARPLRARRRGGGQRESWFLAQVFHEAAASGLRGLLNFTDPVPRRVGGAVVFPGHVGTSTRPPTRSSPAAAPRAC